MQLMKVTSRTETAYNEKLEEYKKRKELRAEERQAVPKAIAILRSDDARDTFKKSLIPRDTCYSR